MTINIANNNPRINYTATSGQTVFTVPFEFFDNTDIKVYIEGTLKTITTHYSVSGGNGSTGTVTMSAGVTLNDEVTLVRDVPMERTTDLTSSYNAASIDSQLDRIVAEIADLDDRVSRTIQINDYELASGLLLPALDSRKGKTIQFNTSSGALEVGPTGADLTAIGSVTSEIATLAGISGNITTVAGSNAQVVAVGNAMTSITAVNSALTNINTVAGGIANINLVGGSIADVNDVADSLGEISAVQAKLTNIDTVAVASTNIATVAGSITQVNNVASKIADVTGVNSNIAAITTANANSTNVNLVANSIDDVNDVGTVITKVTTVADNIGSVNTVAPKVTEISTVSANIGNVNTVATNISSINSAAGSAADALASKNAAATSATNAANSATASASSATAAAASASSITGAETNAANSATAAATSATAAQTAKTAAETALDEFTDIYLGSKSTAPSVDNDGNALATGSIYWNSSIDQLYIWTGSAWDDAAFTASGSVTSFNTRTGAVTLSSADVTNAAGLLTTGGTMTGDLSFGDNDKAIFGAGSDLQIYHDGNSWIKDTGSGNLVLDTNGNGMFFKHGSETLFEAYAGGAVNLRHNDAQKLATTSTGINVTGTVTSDGLTVDTSAVGGFKVEDRGGNGTKITSYQGTTNSNVRQLDLHAYKVAIRTGTVTGTAVTDSLLVADNGDISFYEDTGTTASFVWDSSQTQLKITGRETSRGGGVYAFDVDNSAQSSNLASAGAMRVKGYYGDSLIVNGLGDVSFFDDSGTAKFFWDASAESLGIGTSSPEKALHVNSGTTNNVAVFESTDADTRIELRDSSSTHGANTISVTANDMYFTTNASEAMRIDSSGNVGIGTSSPASELHVFQDSGDAVFKLQSGNGASQIHFGDDESTNIGLIRYDHASNYMSINVNATEAMRIDSSGNLLVGTTNDNPAGANVTGHALGPSGYISSSRDGNFSLSLNRKTNDGDIAVFRKDGTSVGSIGSSIKASSRNIYIGSENTGLYFFDGYDAISPIDPATGSDRDASIDIGRSNVRFKDLHLSGGVSLDGSSGNTLYKSGSDLVLNNRANATMIFGTNNTEHMRIDSSGNVGIGTSSPNSYAGQTALTINSTGVARLDLDINNAYQGYLLAEAGYIGLYAQSGNYITMGISGVGEAMRIDSSSNLLVGKSTTAIGTVGTTLGGSGFITATRSGNPVLNLNRTSSDGPIADFYRGDVLKGSINIFYSNLMIGKESGARIAFGSTNIYSTNNSGSTVDNSYDLGSTGSRFKDVYAVNYHGDGSNLTGVGASTAYGGVGTYIMGTHDASGHTLVHNNTFAGSGVQSITLYTANYSPSGVGRATITSGTLSGTWRSMGGGNDTRAGHHRIVASFVRIS